MKFLVKETKKEWDKKNVDKKITLDMDITSYKNDLQKRVEKEIEEENYTRTVIDVFQNLHATGDVSWLKLLPEDFLKR